MNRRNFLHFGGLGAIVAAAPVAAIAAASAAPASEATTLSGVTIYGSIKIPSGARNVLIQNCIIHPQRDEAAIHLI